MATISLFSSFVFVTRVVVIFVDFVGNLMHNYASNVDFNSLCTWSTVCDVVDILVNPVMPMMQNTVKWTTYSWRWYLVDILQWEHVFSDPFVTFPL